jgi:hypothetical protein
MGSLTDTLKTAPTLEFMFNLNAEERLIILECARCLLRDLAHGTFPPDYTDIDSSDEEIEKLYTKLNEFMNEPE